MRCSIFAILCAALSVNCLGQTPTPTASPTEKAPASIDFSMVSMRSEVRKTLAAYLSLRWQSRVAIQKQIEDRYFLALVEKLDPSRTIQLGGFAWGFVDAPASRKVADAKPCTSEAHYLAEIAKYLHHFSTKDDLALAALLADLALAFDPAEPLALAEAASLPPPDWALAFPDAPATAVYLINKYRNSDTSPAPGKVELDEKTCTSACRNLLGWYRAGVFNNIYEFNPKIIRSLAKMLDPVSLETSKISFQKAPPKATAGLDMEKARAAVYFAELARKVYKESTPEGRWIGGIFATIALKVDDTFPPSERRLDPLRKSLHKELGDKMSVGMTYLRSVTNESDHERAKVGTSGLVVFSGGAYKRMGFSSIPPGGQLPLVITQVPKYYATTDLYIPPNCGPSFAKAARVAFDYVKSIRPILGGTSFTLNTNDAPVDGGSAGSAVAMLFLAHADGVRLDSMVSITGGILPDGSPKPVGGVYSKARAARKILAIPVGNRHEIGDFVVLSSHVNHCDLWSLQVFTYSSLEQLLEIARQDRPENIRKAIELFRTLENGKLSPEEKIKKLNDVLTLAPNHLSAKLLIERLTTNPKPSLSLSTSLYLMYGYIGEAGISQHFNTNVMRVARDRAFRFRTICHPTVAPWAATLASVLDEIIRGEGSRASRHNAQLRMQSLLVTIDRMIADQDVLFLLNTR